jgi:hypothetical protein
LHCVQPPAHGRSFMSAERYRRHAAECIRLSAATSDAGSRRAFHHMAMLWEALERQARRVDRAPAQQQQQPQPQPQPKDAKYPIRRPPSDPPRQTTNFSRPPACTLWMSTLRKPPTPSSPSTSIMKPWVTPRRIRRGGRQDKRGDDERHGSASSERAFLWLRSRRSSSQPLEERRGRC